MATLNQTQAAEVLGVTARRIRQIDNDSEYPPPKDADRQYPAKEFGKWLKDRILAEAGAVGPGEIYDLNIERARLAKWQADRTELEVAVLDGSLIRAEEVERVWGEMLSSFRARCLSIPAKAATLAYAAASVEAAQDVLRELVYEALAELADYGQHYYETGKKAVKDGGAASGADGKPVGRRTSKAKPRGKRRTGSVVH